MNGAEKIIFIKVHDTEMYLSLEIREGMLTVSELKLNIQQKYPEYQAENIDLLFHGNYLGDEVLKELERETQLVLRFKGTFPKHSCECRIDRENIFMNLKFKKILGCGSEGVVCLCECSLQGYPSEVAVKMYFNYHSNPIYHSHEYETLKTLKHPNIISLYGIFQDHIAPEFFDSLPLHVQSMLKNFDWTSCTTCGDARVPEF